MLESNNGALCFDDLWSVSDSKAGVKIVSQIVHI